MRHDDNEGATMKRAKAGRCGRRVVAWWLAAILAVSALAPPEMVAWLPVGPASAVAQDGGFADPGPPPSMDDGGGDSEGGGENLLMFFARSLGMVFATVFLLLSFALVSLVVMCFLQLRRSALMPPDLSEQFEEHLANKQYQEAYELAKNDDSYLGHVLSAGIIKLQGGFSQALEAMQEAEADEGMRLEHKISYVALIGALSPMFGLLGTVNGMVSSFMVIAQSTTAPKPTELAAGISTALVTTLVGLWLAIPAVAAFAMFKNWLQRLNSDVDAEAMRLMGRFQGGGKK